MSLRMAKPSVAPAVGSNPPNCGTARAKLPCVKGMSKSAVKVVGVLKPTVTVRLVSTCA